MQHHRLVLNGPPAHVEPLARALHHAGAEAVPGTDPPRFTWATPPPSPVAVVCARHPRTVVGVERFALLGDTLERLVLRGDQATVLERRPFGVVPDHTGPPGHDLELADGCRPLPPVHLATAARRVAEQPVTLGPGLAGTALDDALLVGAAVGRVCDVAQAVPPDDPDPYTTATPPVDVLDALATLAAAALTAGAAAVDPASSGELAFERAHHLTESYAIAAGERIWSRPGDADWAEWMMYVLVGAAAVIEDCATALHQPPPAASLAVHVEHGATDRERLGHATVRLVTTCLQALALFDQGDCARN